MKKTYFSKNEFDEAYIEAVNTLKYVYYIDTDCKPGTNQDDICRFVVENVQQCFFPNGLPLAFFGTRDPSDVSAFQNDAINKIEGSLLRPDKYPNIHDVLNESFLYRTIISQCLIGSYDILKTLNNIDKYESIYDRRADLGTNAETGKEKSKSTIKNAYETHKRLVESSFSFTDGSRVGSSSMDAFIAIVNGIDKRTVGMFNSLYYSSEAWQNDYYGVDKTLINSISSLCRSDLSSFDTCSSLLPNTLQDCDKIHLWYQVENLFCLNLVKRFVYYCRTSNLGHALDSIPLDLIGKIAELPCVFSRSALLEYALEFIGFKTDWTTSYLAMLDRSTSIVTKMGPMKEFNINLWSFMFPKYCDFFSKLILPISQWTFLTMLLSSCENNYGHAEETLKNYINANTSLFIDKTSKISSIDIDESEFDLTYRTLYAINKSIKNENISLVHINSQTDKSIAECRWNRMQYHIKETILDEFMW